MGNYLQITGFELSGEAVFDLPKSKRFKKLIRVAATALAAIVLVCVSACGSEGGAPSAPAAVTDASSTAPSVPQVTHASVSIPRIGAESTLVPTALDPDGSVAVCRQSISRCRRRGTN